MGLDAGGPPAFVEVFRALCAAPPEDLYGTILRLGGERGWPGTDLAWRLRGAVDRLLGGVGPRKGRRDPAELAPGDPVDFWRVEAVGPGRRLLLGAEMKNPGTARMELAAALAPGGSELQLTVRFEPWPFWGRLYYYASLPAHRAVFRALARGIARAAGRRREGPPPAPRRGPGTREQE